MDLLGRPLALAAAAYVRAIAHYQNVVGAPSETMRLMAEIDRVIDGHVGRPGAFLTAAKA